ncbi:RICIN domain-containing protein [Deminuibacter soli]|uniref:T9SS C-terminal target domain-containing protein n=1 Tax=Deminuibacter soli TaxID=2291815 RepID=A0A3E1NGL3_9BACT|nr:RICIN domain-containing protein [Deminuibacter soli]RFM27027.1 T9SS C-terminal target domain-containing protein [Deminuibacter soli]
MKSSSTCLPAAGKGNSLSAPLMARCLLLLAALFITLSGWCTGTPVYTINSSQATLTVRNIGSGTYGIGIQLNSTTTYYEQNAPLAVEVVNTAGTATWLTGAYTAVQDMGGGLYKCTGNITSANGSVFAFTDTYKAYNATGTFEINRTVAVTTANAADAGFSTRLAFQRDVTSAMNDYDFFAPSIWYKNNADVADNALATDLTDNYYWFREDRMPLPIFMVRQKSNGATFSVYHKSPDGSTFKTEDGLNRVIDGRMKFASMGMQNNTQPLIGMLFPGTEGERTGIFGMSTTKRWAYRSNPVTLNYTQQYSMSVTLTSETDYTAALKNTWINYYNSSNPALYSVNLTQVYLDQVAILNRYWQSINGAPGVPFRIKLDGTVESQNDYNYDMGFVGMQLPNAALLIREGINANNATLLSRGEQMAEWWANNASLQNGCVKTWYDPYPQTWRSYATYMRVIGDGMTGLLWAWNFEKKHGVDKANWLNVCTKAGAWLASIQNGDGSFPRAVNYADNTIAFADKTNTSHVIAFLVDLYKATGADVYLQTALKAGNYIYTDVYQNFRYVGGTPDNPNVPDKEAASMALRSFLALYDLTKDTKWLNAASQTAYYYETWVYSWNVPIPQDDAGATYPKTRSVTGLSVIATGNNAADSYAAIDAFSFYRMYLYNGDAHLLQMAKLLLQNTKQAVNWDRANPVAGYGDPGILGEATNVMIPRGHGVNYYLPWQTYNLMEPLVLMWDVFGSYDISTAETLSLTDRQTRNNNYSNTRGFMQAATTPAGIISGGTYRITGVQSGKVMEVEASSTTNGANISQNQWNNTSNQKWVVTYVGGGYYSLTAVHSGQAVDVVASSVADGANITQWPYYGNANQQWQLTNVGGSNYKIINRNSGKAVDVAGFSLSNGGNIQQFTYNATDNQKWTFELLSAPPIVSGGVYKVTNKNSNKVMEVEGAAAANGANISQNQWMNTDNQKWTVTDVGSGYYSIRAVHSGQAVDVVASSTADGANITQWPYYGNTNQQWQILDAGSGYYKIVNRNSAKVVDVENFSLSNGANISQYHWTGTDNQLWKFELQTAGVPARIATLPIAKKAAADSAVALNPVLTLFPNPASGELHVRWNFPAAEKTTLQVFSIDGKLQQAQTATNTALVVMNTSRLKAGTYLLTISNSKEVITRKFMVTR